MAELVDNGDEPLPLRCHPGRTGLDGRVDGGDGDGVLVPQLFSIGAIFPLLHLTQFDAHTRQKVHSGHLRNLLIPDTIVFRVGHAGHPVWYLNSVSEPGTIIRKNRHNVTPRIILEAFTRRKSRSGFGNQKGSGILAVLISDAHPRDQSENITEQDQIGSATVEYLDEVLLRDFLERRSTTFSGLLQKWVDPKGQNNSMIHAIWTPKTCKVTCLTNNKSMSDRKSTMYERAVTFDGADSFTRRDPVSSAIQSHIAHLCSSMAKHVQSVTNSGCEIQGCTSYFKVRHDGKVTYMWSSSLRVKDHDDVDMPLTSRAFSPVMGVPHAIDTHFDITRQRNYVCPVSNKVCAWNDAKTFITYKMIIQEWNARFRADGEAQAKHSPSTAGIPPSSAGTAVSVRAKPPPMQHKAAGRAKHRQHATGSTGSSGEDSEDDEADADATALVTAEQRLAHARARYARSKSTQAKPPLTSDTCVPELIRKLEHISDVDLYRRLLHDPVFLYKQVRVCSEVASAFSKFATDPACAADGHGLGHFLDDRPMRAKTSNLGRYPPGSKSSLSKSRPSSGQVRPLEEATGPFTRAMSCRHSTGEAISEQRRGPPQLPRLALDLGGERLAGSTAADGGRQQSTGRSSGISHRRSQDLHQHKTRLASARQKSEQLSQGRLSIASSTASARESVQAKRIPPNTLAEGMHIFTTWKQDCKRDDVRLGSLTQRAARISADGAITDRGPCRLTHGQPPAAPVQPLSARPPETARSSRGVRPPRHISVPSAVMPADAVANSSELQSARTELAYHQEQAAIQRRFLEEMINETKLRLNLGSAAASRATTARAPDTPSETTRVSTANAATQGAALQCAATAVEYGAAAAVVVPDQDDCPDDSTDADPDMGDVTSTRGQSQRLDSVCHEDKGGNEDSEMTHDGVQELAEKAEDARLLSLMQQEVQRQTESDTHGLAHSKLLTDGVEADTAAFEEEMLLAALHMATNEEPEKHRLALKGILPELETEEQQYFLKVISDLRGFGEEDAASEADTYVADSYLSNLLHT